MEFLGVGHLNGAGGRGRTAVKDNFVFENISLRCSSKVSLLFEAALRPGT